MLNKKKFFEFLDSKHQVIHNIGILLIGSVTAALLYFEVRNIGVNSKAALIVAEAQRDIVSLSSEKRKEELSTSIIERLAKAVELLSSDNVSIRLAGIYSLERLADDLPEEKLAIARIVSTFLINPPENTQPDEMRRGFTTLLRIVNKIDSKYLVGQEKNIELNGLEINDLFIKNYSFSGFSFAGAYFDGVKFTNVDFSKVNLQGATFKNCSSDGYLKFSYADLTKSTFIGNKFSEASFSFSKLVEAKFDGGFFHDVDFSGANMSLVTHKNVEFDGSIDPPSEGIK